MPHLRRPSAGRGWLLAAALAAVHAPGEASTVAHHRFEEGTAGASASGAGSILDSSTLLGHGTPSGGPTYRADVDVSPIPRTCEVNSLSLELDGSNDQVLFPARFVFHGSGDATVEFWFKRTATTHQSLLWTRSDSSDTNRYNVFVNADGTFGFDYRTPGGVLHRILGGGGGAGAGILVPDGSWTHIAVVRTGATYETYKDGLLAATGTDSAPDLPTSVGWTISGRQGYRYRGWVDELRLSDAALLPSDFLIGSPVPPCCTAPTSAVTGVRGVKRPSASDVTLTWDAIVEASGGYNVWSVGAKEDIPLARAPGGSGIRAACVAVPVASCPDSGIVPGGSGQLLFYQVRGICGVSEGL